MDREELISSFVSITNTDPEKAIAFLKNTDWDLEDAVQQFLENPNRYSSPKKSKPGSTPQNAIVISESPARDRSVFEAFRDLQEESIELARIRSGAKPGQDQKKINTLAALFRPPLELLFTGSFDEAKQKAKMENRYLLVNVQKETVFNSQLLNRDTWSNEAVKDLVRRYYLLWQVYEDTRKCADYSMWYQAYEMPHVAILDPRTGERMAVKEGHIPPEVMRSWLEDFIREHPYSDENLAKPTATPIAPSLDTLSEEEQINIAIALSLQESHAPAESDPTEEDSEPQQGLKRKNHDEEEAEPETKRRKLDEVKIEEPVVDENRVRDCILQLRLPNGQSVQENFNMEDTLAVVTAFVRRYTNTPNKLYSLATTFPRSVFQPKDQASLTIKQAGLTSRSVLIVEEVD